MKSAVEYILWDMRGKHPEIVSRGYVIDVCGDEVLYLGCTPDRSAYFWFGPGNARWMTEEQLAEVGFILHDYRNTVGLKAVFERFYDAKPA